MPDRILVIDDDARIHTLIKAQFDRQRFEVLSSYDGSTGLLAAAKTRPDLILLDVDLPLTQGFEVCRQLKLDRSTQSIPVIFLTASTTLQSTVFGLECGAMDYLTKPFHPAEIQARVRAALRTKSQIERSREHSIHDELTEMPDRKYFDMRLDAELAISHRTGRSLGCLLLDIDNMDLVNTWFGKGAGDEVLKRVGHAIQAACRREDVVCRLEADSYGVLISDATSEHLLDLAERARAAVRAVTSFFKGDGAIGVTVSVGFALSRLSAGTSIVREAHDALDCAKAAGGDCVRAGRELFEPRLAG